MNSKTFGIHATLILLADFILLYFAVDNFESNTMPTLACIELVIGPLQFLTALILLFRRPKNTPVLYVYFILSILLIVALFTPFYSSNIEDLILFITPILIISYLVAHFFLYVVYQVKETQK